MSKKNNIISFEKYKKKQKKLKSKKTASGEKEDLTFSNNVETTSNVIEMKSYRKDKKQQPAQTNSKGAEIIQMKFKKAKKTTNKTLKTKQLAKVISLDNYRKQKQVSQKQFAQKQRMPMHQSMSLVASCLLAVFYIAFLFQDGNPSNTNGRNLASVNAGGEFISDNTEGELISEEEMKQIISNEAVSEKNIPREIRDIAHSGNSINPAEYIKHLRQEHLVKNKN